MIEPGYIAEIDGQLRRGELIGAFDHARACLARGERHPRLRYLSVLALARSGATSKAAEEYRRLDLHRLDRSDGRALWVDASALWARILKDAALAAAPAHRAQRLRRAADAYRRVYAATDDSFPAINAATLALLAGNEAEARALALRLLARPDLAHPADYWAAATRAEALLVLRRWDEAARALAEARGLAGPDLGAIASTRRQLAILLAAASPDRALAGTLLAILRMPRVAHLVGGELPDPVSAEASDAIDRVLDEEEAGFGVGPLWTSGSLLLAERLLARGAELHLVLPFSVADYLRRMRRDRPREAERRARCLEAAATVTPATSDGDIADPNLISYAAEIADGLAETRARRLCTECVEIELGPGPLQASSAAGPARRVRTVPAGGTGEAERYLSVLPAGSPEREIRAFLFADVYGFSAIPESRLPAFWSRFMSAIGEAVDAAGPSVLYRNTWGDALFLVVAEVAAAAELALSIQDKALALRAADRSAPELRIGLHHGPVFRGIDPIRGVPSYFGTQVSRAARVEPIAPPGSVYVTEPFAALLTATGTDRFGSEYVGRVPLPKRYGEHRVYRLSRRWPD